MVVVVVVVVERGEVGGGRTCQVVTLVAELCQCSLQRTPPPLYESNWNYDTRLSRVLAMSRQCKCGVGHKNESAS